MELDEHVSRRTSTLLMLTFYEVWQFTRAVHFFLPIVSTAYLFGQNNTRVANYFCQQQQKH